MNSIINEKYKGKYKGASDPIGELINAQCVGTGEDKKSLNIDDLFKMAENNNLDPVKLDNFKTQVGTKNATGRLRMTIGNMLRSAAIKRGGIFGADGKWYANPSDWDKNADPVEDRQGKSLKAPAEPKTPKADAGKEAAPAKGKAEKKGKAKKEKEPA